ncbi:MAG TPA: hypothetical protein VHV76_15120 [Mycobacteriales bacterium]|jgi:hypothetical protein|nr:hypothetical protein [Mycobacteriales bacterium]
MKRLFYVAAGAAVGIIAVRKASEAAQRFTPAGMAHRAGGVGGRVAEWWEIVKDMAAVREAELREALGLNEAGIDDHQGSTAA